MEAAPPPAGWEAAFSAQETNTDDSLLHVLVMAEYKFTPAAAEEAQLAAPGRRSQTLFLFFVFFY